MFRTSYLLCATLAISGLAACGPAEDPNQAALAELEATFATLSEARDALYAKRDELANLSAPAAAGEEEGEGVEVEPVDPGVAKQLANEITAQGSDLTGQVVAMINQAIDLEADVEETEFAAPVADLKGKAIRIKSDEDILIAREFIDLGGNYRRAIEIYEGALEFDPDYARLQEVLAQAGIDRYMSQERFAAAKKGMEEAEVQEFLGRPLPENIRDYPERKAVAWFFPKGKNGAAAAVWFQSKGDGPLKAYKVDFNAIKGREMPGRSSQGS